MLLRLARRAQRLSRAALARRLGVRPLDLLLLEHRLLDFGRLPAGYWPHL